MNPLYQDVLVPLLRKPCCLPLASTTISRACRSGARFVRRPSGSSIGVASAPDHGVEFEPLFAAADAALYSGKRSGRDTVTPAGLPDGPGRDILRECFIGRTAERQRLRRLIDGVARGEPHVAVVIGEAGVGKSALLKQMAPEVGIRSGCLLVGRCIEAQVRAPYSAWADVVTAASRAGIVPERPWRELGRLVPRLAGSA